MKKYSLLMVILILGIITLSCDDSIDPKAEFQESYVLNCIINMDTTYQVATISRTFDVAGYDPYTNTSDPFISNAAIQIIYNDSVFILNETSKIRTDTSRYKTPMPFYYLDKLNILSQTKPLTVAARTPDGTVLYGSTVIYAISRFYIGSSKKSILPPKLISGSSSASDITFDWGDLYAGSAFNDVYYSPELVILYSHESNGVVENLEKRVAWYYLGGSHVYPPVNTGGNSITFTYANIIKAMQEISDGDQNKQNYKIKGALFRILLMDKNLAAYYSAQKTFLDEFSVRLNQPDFSNVHNGLGIVGAYAMKKLQIGIDNSIITGFGYKY